MGYKNTSFEYETVNDNTFFSMVGLLIEFFELINKINFSLSDLYVSYNQTKKLELYYE